jgi:hypothetical protein
LYFNEGEEDEVRFPLDEWERRDKIERIERNREPILCPPLRHWTSLYIEDSLSNVLETKLGSGSSPLLDSPACGQKH